MSRDEVPAEVLKPCPFCGDRMQIRHGVLRHREASECLIASYTWDNGWSYKWNTRTPSTDQRAREEAEWRPMMTAPRDGTHILIAFGSDGVSSAAYSRDDSDPHPWKFLDSQGDGLPIFNGARDDKYGPTGWMPLPKWSLLPADRQRDRDSKTGEA